MSKAALLILILAFVSSLFNPSCLFAQPRENVVGSSTGQDIEKAKAVLDKVIETYTKRDSQPFMDNFSKDFVPGYSSTKSRITKDLAGYKSVEITYDVLNAILQGDYIILNIRWRKKFTDEASGKSEWKEGISKLTFVRVGNNYKFRNITGARLF